MSAFKSKKSGKVRIEHSLNENEGEFVNRRRNSVLQSLKKLQIKCSQDEVPNIALLGSGGGQRAMVGLLGSLVQLDKAGLLDSILYLGGVSGSTWCMASLYQEPNWSTNLQAVKNKIIQRLNGPAVSWTDAFAKLKKYYYGKDFFSLTDVWAVMFVTIFVKEIDEHTLSEQWDQERKDPFPIYTMIDKQSKQQQEGDPWFEFTPHEAGYSLTGAFVDTSNFGSQFHNGSKKNHQDEFDMLYLQALCGSALADGDVNKKLILQSIKDFFKGKEKIHEEVRKDNLEMRLALLERRGTESEEDLAAGQDPDSPDIDECYQILMDLVDINLCVLDGKDPSDLDESIRATLNDFSGGRRNLKSIEKITDDKGEILNLESYTMDVCNNLSRRSIGWPFNAWASIIKCMANWIWGRNYNFLHNMKEKAVHAALLESETRDYIDAGLLLNSPYFSVLRKERNIDLIISLDFSYRDQFKTVTEAAKICRELKIPFPDVNIPREDLKKPKDFYVFKGKNVPTVIHIPLFNVVNCGDQIEDWMKRYPTIQSGAYSPEMINDLMVVAGKNISNNKAKILEEIHAIVQQKKGQDTEVDTRNIE